jgi:Glutathione S-transferase, N-terminal domain
MIILYNVPLSLNCYKVRLLLSLLGVDYRRVPIDLLKGEHKTTSFLELNPFGEVPVLTEGSLHRPKPVRRRSGRSAPNDSAPCARRCLRRARR